jgi:hypothetical protein
VREYTPEYESFRADAIAVVNGAAITVAVCGFWSRPVFMGPIALLVAFIAFALEPRARGNTIVAVLVITLLAMLGRWVMGYSVV